MVTIMKRLLIMVMLMVVLTAGYNEQAKSEITTLTSNQFLTQFKNSVAGKETGEFVRLTDTNIENHFRTLLSALLANDLMTAESEIGALDDLDVRYNLVELTDTGDDGPVYGFMESVTPSDPDYQGWGAALIRPMAAGYIIYQAPHVKADLYSENIALDAFMDSDNNARVAMFAGTHRYANGDDDGDGEADSDVAHDTENLFHALTDYLANQGQGIGTPYWFIQIHGAANRGSEPTVVGSDGAVSEPPHPTLTSNSHLVQIDDSVDAEGYVSMGVCGWVEGPADDEDGDYLLSATTNVQGNLLESLALRQTFMHFEMERTARDEYIAASGPGYNGIIGLLQAIVTVLGDSSLPVELASFTATISDNSVLIKWRTETEVDNIGFAVYRGDSKDGKYTEIAFVRGAGNSGMPIDYQFIDEKIEAGKTYFYYLEDIDIAGEHNKSDVIKIVVPEVVVPPAKLIPRKFLLLQNYPNPFNPDTWLPYHLAKDAPVTISIYNAKGQLVRTLNLGNQKAGIYVTKYGAAYWDGKNLTGESVSSGVYFYHLRAGDFSAVRRMMSLK